MIELIIEYELFLLRVQGLAAPAARGAGSRGAARRAVASGGIGGFEAYADATSLARLVYLNNPLVFTNRCDRSSTSRRARPGDQYDVPFRPVPQGTSAENMKTRWRWSIR